MQDYAHKAFNNLFISFEMVDEILLVKRRARGKDEKNLYLAISVFDEMDHSNFEFELDRCFFEGRLNYEIPNLVKNSVPFTNKIKNSVNPVIALRKNYKLAPNDKSIFNLVMAVSENMDEAIDNVKKYINLEAIKEAEYASKIRAEANLRYLNITEKELSYYRKLYSFSKIKTFGYFSKNHNINESYQHENYCHKNVIDGQINLDNTNRKIFVYPEIYPNSELWKFGISGTDPFIVVHISSLNEISMVYKIKKFYDFCVMNSINFDIIIINEERESYENYLQNELEKLMSEVICRNDNNKFIVVKNLNEYDRKLLDYRAKVAFDGRYRYDRSTVEFY